MIDSVFVQESIRARTMAMVEPERADYWQAIGAAGVARASANSSARPPSTNYG